MYEARRQRSSWARIKLSIVRKFMSISYRFAIRCSTLFFCCPIIAFWINKFSLSFLNSRLQLFCFQCSISRGRVPVIWDSNLKSGSTSFAIYFAFNFGFVFVQSLVITSFLTQVCMLALNQSPYSAVSSPTSFILTSQALLSTTFFILFLHFVTFATA